MLSGGLGLFTNTPYFQNLFEVVSCICGEPGVGAIN